MTKSPTIRLLTLATVGALALAGCTGTDTTSPDESGPSAEATQESDASAQDSDESAQDAAAPAVPDDVVVAEDLPNEPVGSEVTIGGEPATVCIYGDAYGTSVWAGGAGTSCELVRAVYDEMTAGLDDEDVLHDALVTEVTATDPASAVEYVLTCAPRGDVLTTCVAEGASVHIY